MIDKEHDKNLPWVEKYRPSTLDDLISHRDIIETLQRFMREDEMPHLLLHGPPGTGKTSTILAAVRQLYPKCVSSMVLELNASDDRGINVVRETIVSFASTKTMFGNNGYKFVILDEADSMTNDAQNALRRVIEKFTENARFCLICNYVSKIIPAIKSRCTQFRFGPLSSEQMQPRLKYVINQENLNVTDDGLDTIMSLACGDMRRSLNMLQSAAASHDIIDEESIYACTGHPSRQDMRSVLQWLLNRNIHDTFHRIQHLKLQKGYALIDMLTELHTLSSKIDFPPEVFIYLLDKMSDLEERLLAGSNEKLQLGSLVSMFAVVKEMTATHAV